MNIKFLIFSTLLSVNLLAAPTTAFAMTADLLEDQSYEGEDVKTLDISDSEEEMSLWLEEIESQNAATMYIDEQGNEYYLPEEDVAGPSSLRRRRRGSSRNCVATSGEASWYGPGFNGRKTANGERFNQSALTAAHKTLKFGTILKVTYRDRSVLVRINDAGPYSGGRVIDLSKAAAQKIGLIGPGHGRVTLEVVSCG